MKVTFIKLRMMDTCLLIFMIAVLPLAMRL